MNLFKRILNRLRTLGQRRAVKREIDEELRFHIEQRAAENMAAGMTPEEAAREARKRFGNVQSVREECREVRGASFGEETWRDIRFGVRQLRKNPGFTVVAVLTLALGIGANTAIFAVVNKVLLAPLPYHDPNRLVMIWQEYPKRGWAPHTDFSFPNYIDLRNESRSFESISAFTAVGFNLTGSGDAERITGAAVSENYFSTLGIQPLYGRNFLPDDEKPGGGRVVMVGHALWQRRFGSDPKLIGKSITLNGESCTVVGILDSDIKSPSAFYVPMALDYDHAGRGNRMLKVIGRLKDGVTADQARAELAAIAARLAAVDVVVNSDLGLSLVPLHEQAVGYIRPTLLVLSGAVGFVLLIACTNVAGLLFARAAGRQKEIAIRTALGAGRGRMIRQLLTESLLLALLGGGAGMLLGMGGVHLLVALQPPGIPRLREISWDAHALLFSVVVTLAAGIAFGLLPALQRSSTDLTKALKEETKGSTGGRGQQTARSVLVVVEVAVALILLVGAGLMIRSIAELSAVKIGFNPENVLTMQLELTGTSYGKPEQQTAFVQELIQKIDTAPGVRGVAAVNALPLSGVNSGGGVSIEGRNYSPNEYPHAGYRIVTPEYLALLGIPMLQGRAFDASDNQSATGVAIVNSSMARRWWPNEDPIGKRIRPDAFPNDKWLTVIGIVSDVRHNSLSDDPQPEVYWPYAQKPSDFITLAVRTSVPPLSLSETVRQRISALDATLPVFNIDTLEDLIGNTKSQSRFVVILLGLFAGVALLLASVGIYGVIAFSAGQRTREIGIRMALGAQRFEVLMLVVKQGAIMVLMGILIGLGGALAMTRLMTKLLFGVQPTDPMTYIGVALFLALVAFSACLIPAYRATKVDPMVALRYE